MKKVCEYCENTVIEDNVYAEMPVCVECQSEILKHTGVSAFSAKFDMLVFMGQCQRIIEEAGLDKETEEQLERAVVDMAHRMIDSMERNVVKQVLGDKKVKPNIHLLCRLHGADTYVQLDEVFVGDGPFQWIELHLFFISSCCFLVLCFGINQLLYLRFDHAVFNLFKQVFGFANLMSGFKQLGIACFCPFT